MTKIEIARERWEVARDLLAVVAKELPAGKGPHFLPISIEAGQRFQEWWRLAAGDKARRPWERRK
jgi:hypothetical protein